MVLTACPSAVALALVGCQSCWSAERYWQRQTAAVIQPSALLVTVGGWWVAAVLSPGRVVVAA